MLKVGALFRVSMMYQILTLICVTVSGMALADSETESTILKRLEATEKLVQNLFNEVASLKAQDQIHREQIVDLKKQLHLQRQHNSHLGKLNRRLTDRKLKIGFVEDESLPEIKRQPSHTNIKPDANKNRIRRFGNGTPVAFFAKMDKNLENAGVHQNFIFETVVTNIGNGYNNNSGAFVAPVSGTYVFSATLLSFYNTNAYVQFIWNGQPVTQMYVSNAYQSGQDTISQTIVLHLRKGDVVTIQNVDSDKSFIGGARSIFSGFLLF
ncbi:cerebellin-3-like [Ruditapes philippinarum]|uniref:cerebellin-3-like n=1 Tax=Ruditapes philippinarum TaxID=129788 RepID=UPI00295B457E|nr:cerebellin-3-like [Ruditapes philippinarum]